MDVGPLAGFEAATGDWQATGPRVIPPLAPATAEAFTHGVRGS